MILILSNKWDLTVDFVVAELHARGGAFLRINTEDLTSGDATVTLPEFRILASKSRRSHDLTREVTVIWNRRPGKPFDDIPLEKRPSGAVQRFTNDQWFSWLEALQLIPNVTWINHPRSNDIMESKIRQLFLASRAGFRIPDTIVSNDPTAARGLLNRHGGHIVAKALYSPLIEEAEGDLFVFSNEVGSQDLQNDAEIRMSPSIFQEILRPKTDYRVTVVGDVVLPVRIECTGPAVEVLDWRTQKVGLRFVACTLPSEVEDACRRYVQLNGLVFGAMDLVEHNEHFYFLEINPNGEWGWLQKPNNIPIAETLVDFMISTSRDRARA